MSTATDLAAAAPPIELLPPDLRRWRDGNTGVEYVHVLDSGVPGPVVMVQALTHGNEYCGAIALDELLDSGFRPLRGKLVAAFANVAAYERFDPAAPFDARFVDEDYNRVWGDDALSGPRDSAELRRARALQPFVDAADLLLDLHSMNEPCRPLMVCGVLGRGGEKAAALSRVIGLPGDLLTDTGHPAGLRMIERGGYADPASPRTAVLIECGQHWERSAAAVARDTLWRFLAAAGVARFDAAAPRLSVPLPARQRLVCVTEAVVARSADFRFLVPPVGLSVVPRAGTPIAQDGEHVWRAPCDDTVLVMPSMQHLRPGNTQARLGRFVD